MEIVGDCINRHSQLQARLIEAGGVFRAEQDRQQFSGPTRSATVDLFGQLLSPTLALPLTDASRPTGAFFHAATGLATPLALRLCDLVRLLITPTQERDDLIADVPEPDLIPLPDPDVFTEEQWARADALLSVEEVPRRLSGLLAQARSVDPDLPRLVMLRALHAVSPEIGVALRQGDQTVLLAVDDTGVLTGTRVFTQPAGTPDGRPA